MLEGLRHTFRRWGRVGGRDQVILSLLAIVIGIAAGFMSIGFRLCLSLVQELFYGYSGEHLATHAETLPWYHIVAALTVGGLFIGLCIQWLMPEMRPRGVADVMEAMSLKDGRMRLRSALPGAFVNFASLGVGASAGREGPVVHLGAAMASWAAKILHVNQSLSLTLLGCGVAAAVAASFNVPIAGVFFALEVVIGRYTLKAFAPVVIASVAGTVVSRWYFGDEVAFMIPELRIVSLWEFPGFIVLGLICALAAALFMWGSSIADKIGGMFKPQYTWLRVTVGGFLVSLIAIVYPHVLGVGYEGMDLVLQEQFGLSFLMQLLIAKTAAVCITLGARFGGGVVSPSLFIGAMVGGVYGIIASAAFPEQATTYSLYSIVAMGAVAAPILGAPISTVLMVFELTNNYNATVAIMLASATSTLVLRQLGIPSFFEWQLERRGLTVKDGRLPHLLHQCHVEDVMRPEFEQVRDSTPLEQVQLKMRDTKSSYVMVTGEDERLAGIIGFHEIKLMMFSEEISPDTKARDIMKPLGLVLAIGDDLEHALEDDGEDWHAVVNNHQEMIPVGWVTRTDLLTAYNQTLLKLREEERN